MSQVWADIGADEGLVKTMSKGKAFDDLEKFFGKADRPKVEKKEKSEKKKGPQTVNLLGEYPFTLLVNTRTSLRPVVVNRVSFLGVHRLEALEQRLHHAGTVPYLICRHQDCYC